MTAYIVLVNFTDQGIRAAKDTTKRAKAVAKAVEAAGGRQIGIWWTLGQYDMVMISEVPDDATFTRVLLSVGMSGNVRTLSMRAFSEDEMAQIVAGLP